MHKKRINSWKQKMARLRGLYLLSFLMVFMFLAVFAGCKTSSNGAAAISSESDQRGEVLVSLSDAQGDFVTYTIDVLSITLVRADGTEVETLPLTTRVDFAQYTELAEFITAATVPGGIYVGCSVELDYTDADLWVEDADGVSRRVDVIQDGCGNPVTTMAVDVTLDGVRALPVVPGVPKSLVLDYDLNETNTVILDEGSVIVIVEPSLIADVDPEVPKVHRLRGPLRSVDVTEQSFELYIRPFFHSIQRGNRSFGRLEVQATEETFYEINGQCYQGSDGLSALDALPKYAAVVCEGDLRFHPLRFEVKEVHAGSSVPGGDMDVVKGTVVQRFEDDRIVVKGATLFRTGGVVVFHDLVSVQLDESTRVTRQLSTGTFDIQDISVGQRIVIFGTVTDDFLSSLQLDATNGHARMRLSRVSGTVTDLGGDTSCVVLDLDTINDRDIELYDFTGTGTDTEHDADRYFYEISTSTLCLDQIELLDRVSVWGFPVPYGSAPSDFAAQTIALWVGMEH